MKRVGSVTSLGSVRQYDPGKEQRSHDDGARGDPGASDPRAPTSPPPARGPSTGDRAAALHLSPVARAALEVARLRRAEEDAG